MRFLAYYFNLTGQDYYRTIWADDINMATRIANRFCNKGYVRGLIEQAN